MIRRRNSCGSGLRMPLFGHSFPWTPAIITTSPLLWMEKITEPFSLVLFDRHPDTQRPSFGDITSCGGWVRSSF